MADGKLKVPNTSVEILASRTRRHPRGIPVRRILASAVVLALTRAGPALTQPAYPPIPPPRYEPVPPPPGGRVTWEPGHWHWTGVQYVWVRGRYIARQPRYGRYVPGHWQFSRQSGQYVWHPAHWQ